MRDKGLWVASLPIPCPRPYTEREGRARRAGAGARTPLSPFLPGTATVWLPTRAECGRGPGTRLVTLTSPICSSTSSRGSTVRPLLLLGTGQPRLTGTPGEDADEASEDDGDAGDGGGGEGIRTSSGFAIEQGWDCGIRPGQPNRHQQPFKLLAPYAQKPRPLPAALQPSILVGLYPNPRTLVIFSEQPIRCQRIHLGQFLAPAQASSQAQRNASAEDYNSQNAV